MNTPKINISDLLAKEMSRKEFLRLAGAGVLGVVGVTGFVQNIQKFATSNVGSLGTQNPLTASTRSTNISRGYGSQPYGK